MPRMRPPKPRPCAGEPLSRVTFTVTHYDLWQVGLQHNLLPPTTNMPALQNYLLHKINGQFFDYRLRPYHYEADSPAGLTVTGFVEGPTRYLNHPFVKDLKVELVPPASVGDRVHFKLRAEPTIDTSETDGNGNPGRSRRRCITHLRPDLSPDDALKEWASYRLRRAVNITDLRVAHFGSQPIGHWDRSKDTPAFKSPMLPVAEYEVEGSVIDSAEWDRRLRQGIGKHQAFGLAMVRVG